MLFEKKKQLFLMGESYTEGRMLITNLPGILKDRKAKFASEIKEERIQAHNTRWKLDTQIRSRS